MRHNKKIDPSRPGMGYKLPEGRLYYPLQGNFYPHHDEFLGTTLDADEWATTITTDDDGAGTLAVASSLVTMDTGTATASTASIRMYSAQSSDANIYNIPFRVSFVAALATTAGAGVSPTSGALYAKLGIRDTGETHIAEFHFDMSTAGSSSLASPVVDVLVRSSSTAAGFIASAAHNLWNTAASVLRTATALSEFVIEVTHKGVWFGHKNDVHDLGAPKQLSFFKNPVPRSDLNYFIDTRLVADGTAGYTMTAGVQLLIDSVTVEQLAPIAPPSFTESHRDIGAVRSVLTVQAMATAAAGFVTSGSGLFLGISATSTATAAADTFIAVYDASANSTACFNYANTASSGARLLWIQQVRAAGSTPSSLAHQGVGGFPASGIPFFRGLVVGGTDVDANAAGATSLNALVVYQAEL